MKKTSMREMTKSRLTTMSRLTTGDLENPQYFIAEGMGAPELGINPSWPHCLRSRK